ncbi:ATP-binding protein [Modestobacter altitudinis]|uniref:ATP-binding protein n=1 Tax=Modestobacter altitudinis TaxID=2213158 RepID=UPI00110D1FD6|nr:ATP-binding protein [Modestobacter altitudinis]
MSGSMWSQHRRPAPELDTSNVWRWEPSNPVEVTAQRRGLSAALHDGSRPERAQEDAIENMLLVFEELVSNGLRHGESPVHVAVSTTPTGWLLDVSDAATDQPPALAVGRDPAYGGLGLYLVARLSAAYGWEVDGDRKHVWAQVAFASPER